MNMTLKFIERLRAEEQNGDMYILKVSFNSDTFVAESILWTIGRPCNLLQDIEKLYSRTLLKTCQDIHTRHLSFV